MIEASVQRIINNSISLLTDDITEIIESRIGDSAKTFSQENASTVQNAVKRARLDKFVCKKKGNQPQLDYAQAVLWKFDNAMDAFKTGSHEKLSARWKKVHNS